MGNLNFQDVIRDVHNPENHALNIAGTINAAGQATVNINGSATLYAVVNTSAAGDSVTKLGFVTAAISTPTLFAVVNTSAAGVGNSIVTIANVPLPVTFSGNVTLTDPKTYIGLTSVSGSVGLNAGVAGIGFATVNVANNIGVLGNVTLSDSKGYIGLVTVTQASSVRSIAGNVTLSDSKGFIGLVTVGNTVSTSVLGNVTLSDSKGYIGLVTVTQASAARTITGNLTLSDSKGYIGLVTATMAGSVNTGMTTLFPGPNFIGLVTIGNQPTIGVGANWIGLVTANMVGSVNTGMTTLFPGPNFIGLTTTVIGSAPTIYAVVNTASAGDSVNNIGFATVSISNPTLYAVVNTGAAGVGNSIVTIANVPLPVTFSGNVTLSDSKTYIGLVTANISNATLMASVGVWGNTVGDGSGTRTTLLTDTDGNLQVDIANAPSVLISGNVTLTDSKGYIGLVSISHAAWANPNTYIGLVSVNVGGTLPALSVGAANIGCVTILGGAITSNHGVGNVTLNASAAFIGIVTVTNKDRTITGNLTLSDAKTFIGLATTVNGAGIQFIGLVTAWNRNAGTTKTLVNLPVTISTGSVATIAVPTNAAAIYVTSMLLSANATTQVRLKSGVTYLTGNASLGVTLFPGGGFTQPGSPDSPSWIGLPSGALVVEKFDTGGIISNVAGNIVYFQE